jgi:hypothetical protein
MDHIVNIVRDQQNIETTAEAISNFIDNEFLPEIESVKTGNASIDPPTVDQRIDTIVVVTCHGCKLNPNKVVKINNPNISLLETARQGTMATTPTITRFGPPNVPSILKKIGRNTTLSAVISVVQTHTGGTFSPDESFFSADTQFVVLTPTSTSTPFEIYDAKLFQTGCKIRHSGIFALDDDGEVEDITSQLGLVEKNPPEQIRHKCNMNLANRDLYPALIKSCEQHNSNILEQRAKSERELQNNKALNLGQKEWFRKNIKRLGRLQSLNDDDIAYLKYKLTDGHVETGSHTTSDPARSDVLLSDILNHAFFKKDGTKYLVILHVCKVPCGQRGPFVRANSLDRDSANVDKCSFSKSTFPTWEESGSRGDDSWSRGDSGRSQDGRRARSMTPPKLVGEGGNLNRRKSGSKKKKMHTRAVARKKRNRTKKRRNNKIIK